MTHISSSLDTQSATHTYLEQASSEFAADARTNLAIMMIEHATETRHDARQLRLAEEGHRQTLEAAQVAAMHAEADQIRAAGLARGISGIVGGGLTAAGGLTQISGVENGQAWAQVGRGGGDIATHSGTLIGSLHDGRAADMRADQTELEHRSNASDRRRQVLEEEANEARDLERTALDHLRSVSESNANAEQAVVFRG